MEKSEQISRLTTTIERLYNKIAKLDQEIAKILLSDDFKEIITRYPKRLERLEQILFSKVEYKESERESLSTSFFSLQELKTELYFLDRLIYDYIKNYPSQINETFKTLRDKLSELIILKSKLSDRYEYSIWFSIIAITASFLKSAEIIIKDFYQNKINS